MVEEETEVVEDRRGTGILPLILLAAILVIASSDDDTPRDCGSEIC